MAIDKITFDQIVDWDNVKQAYHNTQKGPPSHKRQAIQFKRNETENLIKLRQEIIDETYEHGPYTKFKVYEPKERTIFAPCYRDKIVHHMIYLVFRDFYEPKFINDSYSCIRGRGHQRAVKRVQHYMRKVQWENPNDKTYVVKIDISKFFPSIDRVIMKEILKKKIKCEKTLRLIFKIIDSSPGGIGLPLGNVTSQILTNVYMNEFDQYVKHRMKQRYYIRYADDMFFFTKDKEEADKVMKEAKEFIENNLNLTISEKKLFKRPVTNGITGLGFNIYRTHISLTSAKKKDLKRRIKRMEKRLNNGESKRQIEQELNSCLSHIQLSNNHSFERSLMKEHYNILVKRGDKMIINRGEQHDLL